jgi:hypothetical protein
MTEQRHVPTQKLIEALQSVVRMLPNPPPDGQIEARNYAITEKDLLDGYVRVTFRFDFRVHQPEVDS